MPIGTTTEQAQLARLLWSLALGNTVTVNVNPCRATDTSPPLDTAQWL